MFIQWRVSSSQQQIVVPRHPKQYPSIGGLRNHQSLIPPPETAVEHQMDALTGPYSWFAFRMIHPKNLISKNTGCINDHFAAYGMLQSAFKIKRNHAVNLLIPVFCQSAYLHIINQSGPLTRGCNSQINHQTRIVELSV